MCACVFVCAVLLTRDLVCVRASAYYILYIHVQTLCLVAHVFICENHRRRRRRRLLSQSRHNNNIIIINFIPNICMHVYTYSGVGRRVFRSMFVFFNAHNTTRKNRCCVVVVVVASLPTAAVRCCFCCSRDPPSAARLCVLPPRATAIWNLDTRPRRQTAAFRPVRTFGFHTIENTSEKRAQRRRRLCVDVCWCAHSHLCILYTSRWSRALALARVRRSELATEPRSDVALARSHRSVFVVHFVYSEIGIRRTSGQMMSVNWKGWTKVFFVSIQWRVFIRFSAFGTQLNLEI